MRSDCDKNGSGGFHCDHCPRPWGTSEWFVFWSTLMIFMCLFAAIFIPVFVEAWP